MNWMLAYGPDTIALVLAALALVVARFQGPTAWARRVLDLEIALADLEERHEATRAQLAKWRGRAAAREQRAETDPYNTEDGAPDPVRDPAAWKAWVNSGGIRYLKGKKRG